MFTCSNGVNSTTYIIYALMFTCSNGVISKHTSYPKSSIV